jgi:gamma-glutamyltranspeptidase / glutathione hydrolase
MIANLRLYCLAAIFLFAGCSAPPPQSVRPAASPAFVTAANPLAVEAGMNVLRRGGSAVDAAIAVQAMLSLAEPQSSGLGGGAFLNYYDASTGRISIYNGRETAPAGATPDMFVAENGAAGDIIRVE